MLTIPCTWSDDSKIVDTCLWFYKRGLCYSNGCEKCFASRSYVRYRNGGKDLMKVWRIQIDE